MKLTKLMAKLEHILEHYGDIEVQLQDSADNPPDDKTVGYMSYMSFFIVPEKYNEGMICNIRPWPY